MTDRTLAARERAREPAPTEPVREPALNSDPATGLRTGGNLGAGEVGAPTGLWNRNFLLLWQGQAVSQLGNQACSLAMAFWILQATGSATLMGLLLAAGSLPVVLLSPIGGAVADRFPRLRIIIACDAIAGAATLALAAAMLSGRCARPTLVAMLFAVSLTYGMVNAFFLPALAAAIPDLAPRDRLSAANSLNQLSVQAAVLLGQGIGGVLFRMLGAPLLFLFDGLSFFFSAGSAALVKAPARPAAERLGLGASARKFMAEIRAGFGYVRQTPGLLAYIMAPTSYNFFSMAVFVLLPFFVSLNLHAGAEWYGFLLAAISCGMIAGFVVAGTLRLAGPARARFLIVLITLAPAPLLVTGFVHSRALALAVGFALGTMIGLINVYLLTLLQTTTPPELRGRVMGLFTALRMAMMPLGMALGGLAGDLTGKNLPLVFTTCGVLSLAISISALGRRSTREFLARG